MNTLRKWMLIAAMSFCASSFANTFSADLSDLWFNEKEAGWGVNVTQQREVVFLTFFIYGPDSRPTWYTGQAVYAGQSADGALVYTGSMFQFTGPYFANFFNPAAVSGRSVGTVKFTALIDRATLEYTIDGITVNKIVSRQTFRNNDMTGQYMGSIKQNQLSCDAPAINGEVNSNTEFSIANGDTTFAMTLRQPDSSVCTYSGDYTQTGRLGRSQGTYSCPGGITGTYDFFEMEANLQGFLGRFIARNNRCDLITGRFAAMRK